MTKDRPASQQLAKRKLNNFITHNTNYANQGLYCLNFKYSLISRRSEGIICHFKLIMLWEEREGGSKQAQIATTASSTYSSKANSIFEWSICLDEARKYENF